MGKTFSYMVRVSLQRILNGSRFALIFFGLCSFGIVFLTLLNLFDRLQIACMVRMIGMGSFFTAFSLIFALGVIVNNWLIIEASEGKIPLRKVLRQHWKKIWNSLMISVPFFLGFLIISACLMLVMSLSMLPVLGRFFRIILTFMPFLSAALIQLLFVGAFAALFLFVPVLALSDHIDYISLLRTIGNNLVMKTAGFLTALIPLFLSLKLISNSLDFMIGFYPLSSDHYWERLVQMLILIFPIALVLTPSIAFFINFSYEFSTQEINAEHLQ